MRLGTFATDERGTVSIEYAILLGMLVIALILVVAAIGSWIKGTWDTVQSELGA